MIPKASRVICFLLTISLLINAGRGALEAVTFGSDSKEENQSSPYSPKNTGDSAKKGTSTERVLLYSVDLPQSQKQRLAESINLLHLTGLQSALAINKLKALDGKTLPDNEILAHLVYAEAALGAVEKAAKKLKSNVDIIRIASKTNPKLREEILGLLQQFFSMPAMAVSFSSTPSDSGSSEAEEPESDGAPLGEIMGTVDDSTDSSGSLTGNADTSEVNDSGEDSSIATISSGGGFFDSCMQTIYSAAHTVGDAASKLKKEIGSGVTALAGAVGNVHTKIGSVVGQKNWANIMAGTKFAATTAGAVVALVVAAPAITTAAAGAGLLLATGASMTGAGLSLVNDLKTIEEGHTDSDVKNLDDAMAWINWGTAAIGLVDGSDIFVNFLGVTGDQLTGSTPGQELTDKQLADFLDEPEHKNLLKQHSVYPTYKQPENKQNEGGGGGCGG